MAMTEIGRLAVVFVGAGIGGVLRYGVGRWLPTAEPGFPWATLLVNVAGCLVIGLIGWTWGREEWVRLGLMVGVLGGFTTFSAFGRETVMLMEAGRWGVGVAYVMASVGLGLAAVWAGSRVVG
jgi:CrcB protein